MKLAIAKHWRGTFAALVAVLEAAAACGPRVVTLDGDVSDAVAGSPSSSPPSFTSGADSAGAGAPARRPSGVVHDGILAYTEAGAFKWKFSKPAWGTTAPAVDREGTIYLGIDSAVYAINPEGSELWSYTNPDDEAATGIAIGADGSTYIAFLYRLVALRD